LHDQLRNLPRTTPRLASFLKDHSEHNLVELKHELDPEAGWSEVVSLSSTPKGWIHKFIDSHYQLRRLFRKVRGLCYFLGALWWESVTYHSVKENTLTQNLAWNKRPPVEHSPLLRGCCQAYRADAYQFILLHPGAWPNICIVLSYQ
jgi:hypothetical protein